MFSVCPRIIMCGWESVIPLDDHQLQYSQLFRIPGLVKRWSKSRRRTRSEALSSSTGKAPLAKKLSENQPQQSRTSSRRLIATAEDQAWTGSRVAPAVEVEAATRAMFCPAATRCSTATRPSRAVHIKRVSSRTRKSWKDRWGKTASVTVKMLSAVA